MEYIDPHRLSRETGAAEAPRLEEVKLPDETEPTADDMEASEARREAKRQEYRKSVDQVKATLARLRRDEWRAFSEKWFPAWADDDPGLLAGFYADDAFYLDPFIPEGVVGKAALLVRVGEVLEKIKEWAWTQTDVVSVEDGFLYKWQATARSGDAAPKLAGVSLVQFDDHRKILRHEVYFDRSVLPRR